MTEKLIVIDGSQFDLMSEAINTAIKHNQALSITAQLYPANFNQDFNKIAADQRRLLAELSEQIKRQPEIIQAIRQTYKDKVQCQNLQ